MKYKSSTNFSVYELFIHEGGARDYTRAVDGYCVHFIADSSTMIPGVQSLLASISARTYRFNRIYILKLK